MRSRRRVAAVTGLAAGAALLAAGCGQQGAPRASDDEPSASPTESTESTESTWPTATGQPWLVRFDTYGGADGESLTAHYVRIVPESGKTQVATMPEVQAPETRAPALLVDAGHRWAVADSRPSAADRKAGRVVVRDLTAGGRARTLDVRRASGDSALSTDWVSFDPTRPGRLTVVSGTDVWSVAVPGGTTSRAGSLPRRKDWLYSGGFAVNSGKPFIEDIASFDTVPAGNGDDVEHPVRRAGGTVLDPTAERPYGDRPEPGCESSAGFVAEDGTAWAFCQAGTKVQVRSLAKGARSWTTLGTTGAVVSADDAPVLALPPAS